MRILDRRYTPQKLIKGKHSNRRYRNLAFIAKVNVAKNRARNEKATESHLNFLKQNEDKIRQMQDVLRVPYNHLKTQQDGVIEYQGKRVSFKKAQDKLGITAYSLLALCYCDNHPEWKYIME